MKISVIAAVAVVLASQVVCGADDEDGGYIEVWPSNPGKFVVVDAQDAVPTQVVQRAFLTATCGFAIKCVSMSGPCPDLRALPKELERLGAKGGIWIVNDNALPISLAAIEDGWGVLNVARLLADSPDPEKLAARTTKCLCRLFAMIHGAGDSPMMPGCVMKQAYGLAGIDANRCATYSPEAYGKVVHYLALAGYKTGRSGTYWDACEEGWAPLPTNAAQKAVWEKVHKLPTNPITIPPESKRKK